MENGNAQRIENYLSNAKQSISFIKPAADILTNARGEQCSVEAIKFSACNTLPLYRVFGMPDGMFVRLEEIFGNTIETQRHTIDTLEPTKVNRNILKDVREVNIEDDTLYYPVGSYVHLGFNLSLPNDEVLYVKEIIITYTGASYTLLDSLGNELKDIPSGLIKLKSNEFSNDELVLWERKATVIYQVENEIINENVEIGESLEEGGCAEVSEATIEATLVDEQKEETVADVSAMFDMLKGKTPEEAIAIMSSMSNKDLNKAVMHAGEARETKVTTRDIAALHQDISGFSD